MYDFYSLIFSNRRIPKFFCKLLSSSTWPWRTGWGGGRRSVAAGSLITTSRTCGGWTRSPHAWGRRLGIRRTWLACGILGRKRWAWFGNGFVSDSARAKFPCLGRRTIVSICDGAISKFAGCSSDCFSIFVMVSCYIAGSKFSSLAVGAIWPPCYGSITKFTGNAGNGFSIFGSFRGDRTITKLSGLGRSTIRTIGGCTIAKLTGYRCSRFWKWVSPVAYT